jgi:hypothetical protein
MYVCVQETNPIFLLYRLKINHMTRGVNCAFTLEQGIVADTINWPFETLNANSFVKAPNS